MDIPPTSSGKPITFNNSQLIDLPPTTGKSRSEETQTIVAHCNRPCLDYKVFGKEGVQMNNLLYKTGLL